MAELSEAASWQARADGRYRGHIAEDWCQGRTAFGGLLATAAVRVMAEHIEPERRLRTVSVTFAGPVASGPVELQLEPVRAGSALSFVRAEIVQDARPRTLVCAGFGRQRETRLAVSAPTAPAVAAPDTVAPMPDIPELTPRFAQHFDYRWTGQHAPYSGTARPVLQGWIRPRDDAPLDAAGLLSLIDAWPPPLIARADRPLPMSSVSWQVNLLQPPPPEGLPAESWWLFEGRCQAADRGYSDSAARLWDAGGRLVAFSRQLVAEFSVRESADAAAGSAT